MMRANLPAGTGPKPALHDGKPILHTHPSGGQVYLADDGTGWWKVEAMPAPTEVLVPVSLIEALVSAYGFSTLPPNVYDGFRALFSQPTPSAEPFQRPEHMSVGTTFVGRTRDTNYTSRWTRVADGLMSGMGIPHDIADIDPSTIRDVTPPAGT